MDQSLRIRAGAVSNRSVLTRAERITKLKEADRWGVGRSPLGLPKVRVYKLAMKKKKVKSKEDADAAATGGAAGAKPAAGAAKPAAGAKPAAAAKPAAKK
jgi:small basic protein (TIGR04137 family)